MKKILRTLLIKISRIIYWITPSELKEASKQKLDFKLKENLLNETFQNFKEQFKKSVLFYDFLQLRKYAITTSLLNDKNQEFYYMEFGVWKGTSANYFSKYVKKFHVFDSFEGLSEDWVGNGNKVKGHFNLNKKIPELNSNIETHVGWVEDTLDEFLKKHNPKINFVHLDMDTYTPTKFTLERLKPYLIKDAIIIFDELYNYIGWENGEYKALKEVFNPDEFTYRAFNMHARQVVIQVK
ncbi:class I SAM-dependent methyltransferase [Candidatus Pelagibacter ubique]|nr:class I SAM-dependent methyltransferase [Candidatus Pelagibacter ubique]